MTLKEKFYMEQKFRFLVFSDSVQHLQYSDEFWLKGLTTDTLETQRLRALPQLISLYFMSAFL